MKDIKNPTPAENTLLSLQIADASEISDLRPVLQSEYLQ